MLWSHLIPLTSEKSPVILYPVPFSVLLCVNLFIFFSWFSFWLIKFVRFDLSHIWSIYHNTVPCTSRLCCPPDVGSIPCWTTLTWWSAATCPASPTGRRRDTFSARCNIKQINVCVNADWWHKLTPHCDTVPPLQLLDMLKFYTGFEINDQTGNALTEKEMTTLHYDKIISLQVNTDKHAVEHFI